MTTENEQAVEPCLSLQGRMSLALEVGEGGEKYYKVPEQQGSVPDLPQSPHQTHWSWHYAPPHHFQSPENISV